YQITTYSIYQIDPANPSIYTLSLHDALPISINSIFQHQLGLGIVGGRLYQAEFEGIESARIAVRILHGEPASSFPPRIVGPLSPDRKSTRLNSSTIRFRMQFFA